MNINKLCKKWKTIKINGVKIVYCEKEHHCQIESIGKSTEWGPLYEKDPWSYNLKDQLLNDIQQVIDQKKKIKKKKEGYSNLINNPLFQKVSVGAQLIGILALTFVKPRTADAMVNPKQVVYQSSLCYSPVKLQSRMVAPVVDRCVLVEGENSSWSWERGTIKYSQKDIKSKLLEKNVHLESGLPFSKKPTQQKPLEKKTPRFPPQEIDKQVTKEIFHPIMCEYYLEHKNCGITLTIPELRRRLNDYTSSRVRLYQMARRAVKKSYGESIKLSQKDIVPFPVEVLQALDSNAIAEVSASMFQGRMKNTNRMFFILTPNFFKQPGAEKALLNIAHLTEVNNLANPLFSINLDFNKAPENKSQEARVFDWIKASLLGDGHLTKNGFFDFVQGLNMDPTHTPYFLSSMSEIPEIWLTPNCFTMSRGIPLKKSRNGLTYSWKTRVRFSTAKISGINEIYSDLYTGKTKTSTDIRNYKTTPSDTIMPQFFKNPGYTLAHLHMQDGSLFTLKKGVIVPVLHVQTKNPEQAKALAWGIYKHTGLKYHLSDSLNNPQPLYLSPSSLNRFIELTQPYIHPSFDYKMPKSISLSNPQTQILSKRKDDVFAKQQKHRLNTPKRNFSAISKTDRLRKLRKQRSEKVLNLNTKNVTVSKKKKIDPVSKKERLRRLRQQPSKKVLNPKNKNDK